MFFFARISSWICPEQVRGDTLKKERSPSRNLVTDVRLSDQKYRHHHVTRLQGEERGWELFRFARPFRVFAEEGSSAPKKSWTFVGANKDHSCSVSLDIPLRHCCFCHFLPALIPPPLHSLTPVLIHSPRIYHLSRLLLLVKSPHKYTLWPVKQLFLATSPS